MESINHWFSKQRRLKSKLISVYSLIIGDQPWNYLFYRLRYFILNTGIVLFIQLIEFYFILQFFTLKEASFLFVFRLISAVLLGCWWFALESMREKVRILFQEKKKTEISYLITCWFYIALAVGTCFVSAAVIASIFFSTTTSIGILAFYPILIAAQTTAQFIIRVYHSGCFAIKRVYRPFWSISISEITTAIILLLGWPVFQFHIFPIAVITSSIISLYLTWHFSRRTMHLLNLPTPQWTFTHQVMKNLSNIDLFYTLKLIFLGMVLNLQVLAFITIFRQHINNTGIDNSLYLFVIAPLFMASSSWSRLFYFDLQKFSQTIYHYLFKRLLNINYFCAILVAIITALLASIIIYYWRGLTLSFASLILLLFCANSLFSIRAISYFCKRQFKPLYLVGILLLVVTITIGFLPWDLNSTFALLTLSLWISVLILFKTPKNNCIDHQPEYFYEMIRALPHRKKPIELLQLQISQKKNHYYGKRLHETLAQYGYEKMVKLSSNHLVFFATRNKTIDALSNHELMSKCTGVVLTIEKHESFETGEACKQSLIKNQSISQKDIETEFATLTNQGIQIDVSKMFTEQHPQLNKDDWPNIFFAVQFNLRMPLDTPTQSPWLACCLLEHSYLKKIYLTPFSTFSDILSNRA